MELFGTAWDGYGPEEKELRVKNSFKDAIGIPFFGLWYLLLGLVFIHAPPVHEEADMAARFFLAFVSLIPLFMHSQGLPCPRKDQAAYEVQQKMGQWVYLTRHCLTLQFWHQVFSLLCAWAPSLAAVTNGLSVCMGALGAFVTIQYFALVVPAEGFKEECKQWAEKGPTCPPRAGALHWLGGLVLEIHHHLARDLVLSWRYGLWHVLQHFLHCCLFLQLQAHGQVAISLHGT